MASGPVRLANLSLLIHFTIHPILQRDYYSWDVRLLSLFLAVVSLVMYYRRYHLTRTVVENNRCGGWLYYLPVCLCCAKDSHMKAMENEV